VPIAALRPAVAALGLAGVLLLVYWEALLAYWGDQHYQEHFVYLWAFFALALWRSLRPPFRTSFALSEGRDRWALLCFGGAIALLAAASLSGSSTIARCSLAAAIYSIALLAVPQWNIRQCTLHGMLLLLCFGLPYSLYFPITSKLQWGAAAVVALPAAWGWFDYYVDATAVQFPHYRVVITADCSGLGQALTFLGIAALGVLVSAPRPYRGAMLATLAVALAWLSNLTRLAVFLLLVGLGVTESIESDFWHATIGFLVFMPFVVLLITVVMKTHRAPLARPAVATRPGRISIAWLALPLLVTHLLLRQPELDPLPEPSHFAALTTPPGHILEVRAPSETADQQAYGTPWLLNARFRPTSPEASNRYFDLLHYTTRSTSHLCVHKVAACLDAIDQEARYEPPVEVAGQTWWRIALDREPASDSMHVYFAFVVDGTRMDDSAATQWQVFRSRLLGHQLPVRLDRIMLPGPLPATPDEYATGILAWLGKLTHTGQGTR